MPVTIKSVQMKYKDQYDNYVGVDAITSNETTAQQIAAIESAGTTQTGAVNSAGTTQVAAVNGAGGTQVTAVQNKGAEVLASIPSDYTTLSGDVDSLKSAINSLGDAITQKASVSDMNSGLALKINKPSTNPNGTNGQLLRTNGDGTTTWVDQGPPTDEQTAKAVDDWFDAHPEARATVEDGSLTEAKFSFSLVLKAIKDYVTPQMFNGKGDGETDDTQAIHDAIAYTRQYGGGVYLPKGTYLVSSMIQLNDLNPFVMDTQAIIKASAAMNYVVEFKVRVSYLVERPQIINLRVDGDSKATNGVLVQGIVHNGTTAINGLEVKNCLENGVVFKQCQGALFQAVRSFANGGNGIVISGCSNAKFIGLSAMDNDGDGIVFSSATDGDVGSGACYVFGIHAEQNDGDGIHFINGTGLISIYSGWLEGNKTIPIHIVDNSKCLLCGMYVVHSAAYPWAVVNSDYAIIRDVEVQCGGGGIYTPTITGKSIIENMQSYNQTFDSVYFVGDRIAENLGTNVIANGDMQEASGGSNSFAFYYCTPTYQDTEKVETGKTYSIKAVVTNNNFAMRKDGTTGLMPGCLYKITARFYYVGEGCSVRLTAINVNPERWVYSNIKEVSPNQWEEITGYFYCISSGEVRVTLATVTNNPKNDDVFYISKMYCQPCFQVEKVSTRMLGNTKVYESIEPAIMK